MTVAALNDIPCLSCCCEKELVHPGHPCLLDKVSDNTCSSHPPPVCVRKFQFCEMSLRLPACPMKVITINYRTMEMKT